MRFSHLHDWLGWQEGLHPQAIELGLSRCREVAEELALLSPPFPVITVAGTNGKGSVVAFLESLLAAAGFHVGTYTSPHLMRYTERIRLGCHAVTNLEIVEAFARVDQARGDTSLTYFEFGTLAAMDLFQRARPDFVVLEVGLGGRLDAVNLFDPAVAVITTVDLDHADWLGDDRESIGREKAGIVRPQRPLVCGEPDPPETVMAQAASAGSPVYRLGREFHMEFDQTAWRCSGPSFDYSDLPMPMLRGSHQVGNAATALMTGCLALGQEMPFATAAEGIGAARLPGRFQVFPGPVERIVDVAHNAQAARVLAGQLLSRPCSGRTLAVTGMLKDKDIPAIIGPLAAVDHWFLASLPSPRGLAAASLAEKMSDQVPPIRVSAYDDVTGARAAAMRAARPGDRVLAFGSFLVAGMCIRLETSDARPET
ncbi:MAG: bifunctional tetrahydrofolate synthase/dihydrofolate synthase [Gammaproteobacteria bacterium]|nr:MAG: bifunctional tetrahydrofolate synthase/dihydrofolate synthase [Gammaproteobacteria bacterium]